ncbi:MAG TPA: prepilin peptidase [Candidatus Limnocylindria bacterium]
MVASVFVAAALVAVHGPLQAAPLAAAVPGMLAIARCDAATHRIPNRLLAMTVIAFAVVALGAEIAGVRGARTALATAGLWFGVLTLVHLLDPHLGPGDVKLGIVLGLVLGWAAAVGGHGTSTASVASAGAFLAACVATLVIASRSATPAAGTPFAPALVTATLVAAVGVGV